MYLIQRLKVKILNYKNQSLLTILLVLLSIIIYLLVSNVAKGFDITDESYYILYAQHQSEIYPVIRRDGFFTGIIYLLVNENLGYLKLSGIFLLIGFSAWLALELFKYLEYKLQLHNNNKWLYIAPIIASSLAYYRHWLITPSYNWLALLGSLLILISLLRIVNNRKTNYEKLITFDYLLLVFALNMAFMAKPTTALVLGLIVFLFLLMERQNINVKKSFFSIFMLTVLIVMSHILWSYGNIETYYERLIESLHRMSTVDSRYTLSDRLISTITELKGFFFEKYYFHKIDNWYILFIAILLLFIAILKSTKNIGFILLYLIFIGYSFLLFQEGLILNSKMIWFRLTELMVLSWGIVFVSLLYTNKVKIFFKQSIFILIIIFIFSFASIAYALGTNGTMVYAMSSSIIFIVIGIIVANAVIDDIFETNIFLASSGIVITTFILYMLLTAYEHPYRLITSIKDQNQKVDLLGGLYVDEINKKYIESLQKIKKNNSTLNKRITLLDMTGGSPGANVILEADFFGEPWLAGGYPGSKQFAERVLKPYLGTDKLRKAWILVAPKGKRKLDLKILTQPLCTEST